MKKKAESKPNVLVWFRNIDITYDLIETNEAFNQAIEDCIVLKEFAIVKDMGGIYATEDYWFYNINSSPKVTFKLLDYDGDYHIRYSGEGPNGIYVETDDITDLVVYNNRKAFVVLKGTPLAATPGGKIPGGIPDSNDCWFDPKLPKRIDII
jgi:hypothetical protein